MDTIIRQVCPSNVQYTWVNKNERKAYDLVRHCRSGNENCHFSVPTVSAIGVTDNQDVSVARLYSIAGVAFVTLTGKQTQVIMESFRGTILSGWPIFFFSMALTFLSGVILWIFVSGLYIYYTAFIALQVSYIFIFVSFKHKAKPMQKFCLNIMLFTQSIIFN